MARRKELNMFDQIDMKTLTAVNGGANFTNGQSFQGQMFPGAPTTIPGGSSEVYLERAEKAQGILQNLHTAGFGVTQDPQISGKPLVGAYTATCTRAACQWNG
jgi:hypothetical protein